MASYESVTWVSVHGIYTVFDHANAEHGYVFTPVETACAEFVRVCVH